MKRSGEKRHDGISSRKFFPTPKKGLLTIDKTETMTENETSSSNIEPKGDVKKLIRILAGIKVPSLKRSPKFILCCRNR